MERSEHKLYGRTYPTPIVRKHKITNNWCGGSIRPDTPTICKAKRRDVGVSGLIQGGRYGQKGKGNS